MPFIELGPVPAGERCAQVGAPDHLVHSMHECEVFQRMLLRGFPVPDGLPVRCVIESHCLGHELGRTVSIGFADGNPAAFDFACNVELSVPDAWDEVARYELAWLRWRDAALRGAGQGSMLGGDRLRRQAACAAQQAAAARSQNRGLAEPR